MNKERLQEILKSSQELARKNNTSTTKLLTELLETLLDEPKAVDEQVKPLKWRAEHSGIYFFIGPTGGIIETLEGGGYTDDYQYLIGNYYRTREEAEQALEVIKAKGRLEHSYYALVGDWKPDWNVESFKFYVTMYRNTSLEVDSCMFQTSGSTYFFDSRGLCDQFIKENEGDLKLVFNIKDND